MLNSSANLLGEKNKNKNLDILKLSHLMTYPNSQAKVMCFYTLISRLFAAIKKQT